MKRRMISRRVSKMLFRKYSILTRKANLPRSCPRGGFRL